MRRITLCLGMIFLGFFVLQVYGQAQPDERLFREAKILIFDKKWEQAQEKLEELMKNYPDSSLFSQALFYTGKSLQEQEGKEAEAHEVYSEYILRKDRNENLAEESEISIIDLAFELYGKGKKSYLKEIENRTLRPNKVVKYYAAFKLSYFKDKKVAKNGIPILKEILSKEKDKELRDRAKIALLRIDPDVLKEIEEETYERKARILHIRVQNIWKKEPDLSINIPWALADLALSSIPEKEKTEMREEGYDLDKIIKELMEYKGKIIEIKGKQSIIKIWID